MAEIDTQAPAWLQRNWAPRETFDPSPWLQERYRRQVEARKLPLQLQGMELANKANALAVEHQGMANDLLNDEMNAYAEELPALRSYLEQVGKTPGGSLTVPPPAFRSKRALTTIAERQKMDADTTYGLSLHQRIVSQTTRAAELMSKGAPPLRPGPDGLFDEEELARAGEIVDEREAKQRLAEINARTTWHFDEDGNPVSYSPTIEVVTDPLTGKPVSVFRRGPNSASILNPNANGLGFVEKKDISVIYDRIKRLQELHDAESETSGIGYWKKPNQKRAEYAKQIEDLKQQAKAIESRSGAPVIPAASPGTKVRVKNPNGQVGWIPANQLKDAIASGYEEIK